MIGRALPRQDPDWYTPDGLPEELLAFSSPVRDGLGVGAAGKVGLLELTLAPTKGTTRVQRQYQKAPLHIFRPIHLDAGRPDMAFVYLQQSGDGLVQGDRYRIDIDCADGAAVHLTTQAPTKVYGARDDFATQLVNLRVGAGAVLEYLPDPIVPFRGSRLFQRTCLTVDPEATVILGETLLPGRVAYEEAHVYDLFWAETEVHSTDGSLLFADVLRLNPAGGENPRAAGLLAGHDVVASLYILTNQASPGSMVPLLRSALTACPDVLAGVTELPNGCGTAVRLLGATSKAVEAALRTAWNTSRHQLLGIPAPNLRKG